MLISPIRIFPFRRFPRGRASPRHLHRLFENEGVTFSEFVIKERLTRAHRMLVDPRFVAQPISMVALTVGFGDLSYFNRCFRRQYGMTPSDARAEAKK